MNQTIESTNYIHEVHCLSTEYNLNAKHKNVFLKKIFMEINQQMITTSIFLR